jgi:hypothetical protein
VIVDHRCPHCDARSNIWLSRTAQQMHAGDISVCSSCFGWSVYGRDIIGLFLRAPGEHERRYWEANEDLLELLVAIQLHANIRVAIAWWESTAGEA